MDGFAFPSQRGGKDPPASKQCEAHEQGTGACFSIPKCPFSLPYLFLGSMRPSKMLDLTLIREGLSWVRQVMIRKSWVIRPMKETHIIIDRKVDRPQES
jgi:hypothetical protein